MTKKLICAGCKEEFDRKEFGNFEIANLLDGKFICAGCSESERERPSTLIKWNGIKEVVQFGKFMAWTEEGEEPEAWFIELLGKNRRKWKSSGGWSEYYETKFDGLVSLANGWVTGWPDETIEHKKRAGDLFEDLNNKKEPLPGELFWLFESTSNLFSTASEILVKEKDKDSIVEWLKDHGYTLEDLEEAFG